MESHSNETIILLLDQVINLLTENNQELWANCLKNLRTNYLQTPNKKEAVLPIKKIMLGGAGSLSDVVLYRNKKPLIKENNQLYDMLNELYEICNRIEKMS